MGRNKQTNEKHPNCSGGRERGAMGRTDGRVEEPLSVAPALGPGLAGRALLAGGGDFCGLMIENALTLGGGGMPRG